MFSTHILQEVEAICDRVIIINKGEIVADDRLSNLQKGNKDKHVVIVKFKEAVDKTLLEKLNDVSVVEGPVILNTGVSEQAYKLQTSNPESVRKQILELSLQHNLNIVALQSETRSLEDIFKALTN